MSNVCSAVFCVVFFGLVSFCQSAGGPTLVPSEPIDALARLMAGRAQQEQGVVRPLRRDIKPSGDPIYIVEEREWDGDQWRTYRRPKVDPFSRDSDGVAIKGYDVLSFVDKAPEKGTKLHASDYGGVTWWFTTEEHRRVFAAAPESFLPEYGGFCAYSVGRGVAASADPLVYAMIGGKLYLFFDPAAKTVWEQERSGSLTNADRNWPKLHR